MISSSPRADLFSCCFFLFPAPDPFSSLLLGTPPPLGRSIMWQLLGTRVRCEGVLTGHAGYFNVGGLYRLDIPGQGVSCGIRTSWPGDTVVQQFDCAEICSHVARTRSSCRTTQCSRYYIETFCSRQSASCLLVHSLISGERSACQFVVAR